MIFFRKKKGSLLNDQIIKQTEVILCEYQWNLKQISGKLKREGVNISNEIICRYIWQNERSGGALYK